MAHLRDVLDQALDLPPKQRARVAQALIASLGESPPEDPETIAKAWDAEIARRVDDVSSGRVKAVSWSAVKKEMGQAITAVRAGRRRTPPR